MFGQSWAFNLGPSWKSNLVKPDLAETCCSGGWWRGRRGSWSTGLQPPPPAPVIDLQPQFQLSPGTDPTHGYLLSLSASGLGWLGDAGDPSIPSPSQGRPGLP